MQDLIVPGWAMFLIVTFGGGWIWWMIVLTKMAIQSKTDNELATQKDAEILSDISHLNIKLDDTKRDFHEAMKSVMDKLDKLSGEFQFMRGLITSQRGNKSE